MCKCTFPITSSDSIILYLEGFFNCFSPLLTFFFPSKAKFYFESSSWVVLQVNVTLTAIEMSTQINTEFQLYFPRSRQKQGLWFMLVVANSPLFILLILPTSCGQDAVLQVQWLRTTPSSPPGMCSFTHCLSMTQDVRPALGWETSPAC